MFSVQMDQPLGLVPGMFDYGYMQYFAHFYNQLPATSTVNTAPICAFNEPVNGATGATGSNNDAITSPVIDVVQVSDDDEPIPECNSNNANAVVSAPSAQDGVVEVEEARATMRAHYASSNPAAERIQCNLLGKSKFLNSVTKKQKERKARVAEKKKRDQEQKEAREKEELLTKLKRDESDAKARLLAAEGILAADQFKAGEAAFLAEEEAAWADLGRLQQAVRKAEAKLDEIRRKRADKALALGEKRAAVKQAKESLAATTSARIAAVRDIYEHPATIRRQYKRGCAVCLATNPNRRAAFVACGHTACELCAEQLEAAQVAADGTRLFTCPHCRATTGYVRLFEEEAEAEDDDGAESDDEGEEAETEDGTSTYKRQRTQ